MSKNRKLGFGSQLPLVADNLATSKQSSENERDSRKDESDTKSKSGAYVELTGEIRHTTFLSSMEKTAKSLKDRLSNSFSDHTRPVSKQKTELNIAKRISKNWQRLYGLRKDTAKALTTSRKFEPDKSTKYRRGPLAVEDFSGSSLQHVTNGTIDSDDEDDHLCRPSSKGLLIYFKELGKSTNENEKVDLEFITSLFEAGADANHQDRLAL